jgi:hypothetical protein
MYNSIVYRRNLGLRPQPVRTAALRAARRANGQKKHRPQARLEWLGTASSTEVHRPLARKASGGGGRRGGPSSVPLVPGGNDRHLWEGQTAGGAVGRSNCGCGVVPGARGGADEQSRNVLSFHGDYARDSTFYQGFRLRTGGGGWGSRSGCNDLASGRGGGRWG